MELEAKGPLGTAGPAKLALALLSTIVALGLFAAQASAVTLYHHPLLTAFGPKGVSNTAKFNYALGVAVDQGSHDVYVIDSQKKVGEPNLYRFTSSGQPHPFSAGPGAGTNVFTLEGAGSLAIAPPGAPGATAGDLYIVIAGKVEVYTNEGVHLGTIDGSGNPNPGNTVAKGVTVDPAGNLYISYDPDPSKEFGEILVNPDGHLDKYVPTANPPKNSDFDSELRFEGRGVGAAAFTSSAFYAGGSRYPLSFPGGGGSGLAAPERPAAGGSFLTTDFSNGDLYTLNVHTHHEAHHEPPQDVYEWGIDQFDDAGNLVSFVVLPTAQMRDLDVDATSGQLYIPVYDDIVTKERDVRVYGDGEAVQPPSPSIDPVTSFDFQSAHFTGTVNPGGTGKLQETAYRFECKPACPGLEEERSIPGDGADHVVSDDAVELKPATSYEVTLIARNLAIPEVVNAAVVESTTSFETPAKPSAVAPEVTIDPVGEFDSESAHLSGTVDPKGTGALQATSYRFEYSADGLKWSSAPEQGPIEGEGPQAVSTEISGLSPNTTYQVRLHAKNVGGEVTSVLPNPTFTTDSIAPLVEATHATHVLSGSAQLNGRIDPANAQTSYYFQWGTADCASNPCASAPASKDGDAGSGSGFTWVKAQISGLSPSTAYSYRLIAKNPAGETTGASASFTTEAPPSGCPNEEQRVGASAALPDCRAYEMVSPLEKAGGNIASLPKRTRISADGNAVTFMSTSAFAGAVGEPFTGVEYIALRGADGWQTHPISPYQQAPYNVAELAFSGSSYTGLFSADLDTAVYRALAPIEGATSANVAQRPNLYLATGLLSGEPKFQLLSDSETPLGPSPEKENVPFIAYADASADFGKVAFESFDNLTAQASGAATSAMKLYEWEGGTLRLAGILPDSACGSPPCVASQSVAGAGANLNVTYGWGTRTDTDHVVSDDGSKVFFTVGETSLTDAASRGRGSIYARIDGKTTVQIDASERTTPDPAGSGRSQFDAASADGDVVYFTSNKKLVDDPHGANLYRYEFDNPAGQRLTAIPLPNGEAATEVEGLSRSGDFAYVKGGNALYVVHDGKASLAVANFPNQEQYLEDYTVLEGASFRVTPDGRHVVFMTKANLVGYDTFNPNCWQEHCAQVYSYSYDSNELSCVSCNFGHPPIDEALYNWGNGPGVANFGLPGPEDTNASWPLSADGRYAFFSSAEALVPKDSNGKYDAYVYDTEKGEVRLLSSGQCNCKSLFVSASPDGHDAFFTTNERLVRADSDTQADFYDARIGGGIASQNALPPAECQGDACQGQPESPPQVTPASAGFSGPGSPAAQRKKARHKRKKHARHGAKHKRANHVKQGGSK